MKSWKANFAALLAAQILAMIGFGLSFPVIPLFLEEDIGITDPVQLRAWVGLIQSTAAITMAIFAPIWGHLADVFSRRAMLLRSMFGGALVISLMTFVNSPWQFLVLRGIQGCLTGTVAAATVLVAAISPPAQVAFALGLLTTGIAVGNSLGPLVGGVISDFLGYRAAFFSTGLCLALSGAIVLKWVDSDKKPLSEQIDEVTVPVVPQEESQKKQGKKITFIPDFRPIAASPVLITIMLIAFGIQVANGVAIPMLPLFLKELVLRASEEPMFIASSTGIVLGVGAAFSALAAVLVGKFSLRIGYWKTLIFCLAAGAFVTIPQTFVTNMYQLMALRAVSSFFIGGAAPIINAIIAISAEKKIQGAAFGFNSSISAAGMALGPMIGSAVAILNLRAVFIMASLILGFSAWMCARRRKMGLEN